MIGPQFRQRLQALRQFIWRVRRRLAVALVETIYGEDMLWDPDDPECPIYSIQDWGQDTWGETNSGATIEHKFQRAFSLPSLTYRITCRRSQVDDDIQYEYRPICGGTKRS